jgi:long-chain acyl-CoA synthetase
MVCTIATTLALRGVGEGDVVAAILPNRVELVAAMFAAWLLGASLTPVNPALTPADIDFQLKDSGARLAVVDATTDARPDRPPVISVDRLPDLRGRIPFIVPKTSDLALLVYTSGTTGRPKGVMLDHANAAAAVDALASQFRLSPDDRALVMLPLFHVGAIFTVLATLSCGGSAIIQPRFHKSAFWRWIEQYRPTLFNAVPTILYLLSDLPQDIAPDTSSVRLVLCGGAPMPHQEISRFEQRYGIPVLEGYGLSESTVALAFAPLDGPRRPGSVGRPLPGVRLRIVDDEDQDLPEGQAGEILAAGPMVMRGYFGRTDETALALRGGWLHTGDVGFIGPDGDLRLVDRKKDLIIRAGENIAPKQVEAALQAQAGVLEAAVIGRPHPVLGEEPVAFVVPEAGATVGIEAVLEGCRTALAPFQVPKAIYLVDDLPRNAVGKIRKDALRASLLALNKGSSPD